MFYAEKGLQQNALKRRNVYMAMNYSESETEEVVPTVQKPDNALGISQIEKKPSLEARSGVRSSGSIGKLVEALCKAQLEFQPVVKANINPQFKSKYADLSTIIAATMPSLAKHGLAVIQTPNTSGKDLIMTTIIAHSSGEWIANDLTMPATMRQDFSAQTIGSAVTYSRRYALQSILGVAADVDDDGTEASGGGSREAAQNVAQAKIAALKASQSQETPIVDETAALFYVWNDESQTAQITGHKGLMKLNEDILRPLKIGKELVANANQLEDLKYQLERRNTTFRQLKAL